MNQQEFCLWEAASSDTIDVKRIYIDLAGDLVAGILLSQIVYWHLPGKNGRPRLRVWKGGHQWLAKQRTDWWDEVRISVKQFDRAIKILEDLGLVETGIFRFSGSPTKHVRILWDTFLEGLNRQAEIGYSPKGKIDIAQNGISLTETTAEITKHPVSKKRKPKPIPTTDPLLEALSKPHTPENDSPIERIRRTIAMALEVELPTTDFLLKSYNHLTDAVLEAFNNGKQPRDRKPLDHDQAAETVKAIEWCVKAATKKGKVEYPWNGSSVTVPAINQVVTALKSKPWLGDEAKQAKEEQAQIIMRKLAEEQGHV